MVICTYIYERHIQRSETHYMRSYTGRRQACKFSIDASGVCEVIDGVVIQIEASVFYGVHI